MQALLKVGIEISDFQEYHHSPYDCFENTIQIAERKFQIKGLEQKIPMVYSILGTKKDV